MKPELIPADNGTPAQIKISQQYGQSLKISRETEEILYRELLHQEGPIGSHDIWFRDTPEVRQILKIGE